MTGEHKNWFYTLEWSAVITVMGIILLFSGAVLVTLIAPNFVETTWTQPSSSYQVQMYEMSDPNFYISDAAMNGNDLQFVHHIKEGYTLCAFQESATVRILASPELEKYVTQINNPNLQLTSKLLLLRKPQDKNKEESLIKDLQKEWEGEHPNWKEEKQEPIHYIIWELYDPQVKEAFVLGHTDGVLENWVDKNFTLLESFQEEHYKLPGVIYVSNPVSYRYTLLSQNGREQWHYYPEGTAVQTLEELKAPPLAFASRKELIAEGEHIYAIEGCWYCHTDQTRTLVQDVVLNGAANYPAPPSSPNEYIYQRITFPGTKRNGPDLSRVGIKRPSRDWHKAHFWAPKTQSLGSIMPS